MTPIGYFARQTVQLRAGQRGQAAVLFMVVAGALITLLFGTIRVHHLLLSRVTCANEVDSIALSAATWEARSLNIIAALNEGVTRCLQVIRWTSLVWAGLAIAAAFGAGLPAFLEYTRQARRLISGYWDTAHLLVEWSLKVRSAAPYLVLAEVTDLSRQQNVVGILAPFDPTGRHDGKNTLELHLEPGPPVALAEAVAPVSAVLNRLRKSRFLKGVAKAVASLLDAALQGLDRTGKGPIRMLVPEKDFPERQYVRFAGSCTVPELPIPFLSLADPAQTFAETDAEPYGGGSLDMTWKSRLTEHGTGR
jgi:hypothetical protein